ncbi:hypothetical protein B484DRAFT_30263, partial [Ochromonadaceae sp. CCMP2298]
SSLKPELVQGWLGEAKRACCLPSYREEEALYGGASFVDRDPRTHWTKPQQLVNWWARNMHSDRQQGRLQQLHYDGSDLRMQQRASWSRAAVEQCATICDALAASSSVEATPASATAAATTAATAAAAPTATTTSTAPASSPASVSASASAGAEVAGDTGAAESTKPVERVYTEAEDATILRTAEGGKVWGKSEDMWASLGVLLEGRSGTAVRERFWQLRVASATTATATADGDNNSDDGGGERGGDSDGSTPPPVSASGVDGTGMSTPPMWTSPYTGYSRVFILKVLTSIASAVRGKRLSGISSLKPELVQGWLGEAKRACCLPSYREEEALYG